MLSTCMALSLGIFVNANERRVEQSSGPLTPAEVVLFLQGTSFANQERFDLRPRSNLIDLQ